MTRRGASLLAGLLLLLIPGQAIAQQAGCRTLRALTNADRRNFADLRFGVGSGALSVSAGTRSGDLDGPAECEISSIHDNRDIDCRWRFFDQAQATQFYEPLLARMRSCLREPVQEAEIATRNEGWRILRRHEALLGAEYSQTQVELLLVDASRRSDTEATPDAPFYVQLRVEFEQGD